MLIFSDDQEDTNTDGVRQPKENIHNRQPNIKSYRPKLWKTTKLLKPIHECNKRMWKQDTVPKNYATLRKF